MKGFQLNNRNGCKVLNFGNGIETNRRTEIRIDNLVMKFLSFTKY